MTRQTRREDRKTGATVAVPVPPTDPDLFKHTATADVLRVTTDRPYETFTMRELARRTDNAVQSVKRAVDVLAANGMIEVESAGNRRLIGADRTRLSKSDDPTLEIPQPEFHRPVRAALDRLDATLDDLRGVLVFGSVARGNADRRSDVDLWVLADDPDGQHRANELAKRLGQERFDGDRYEFQILVETPESARGRADRLTELFAEAITLVDDPELRALEREVLDA
ncbi:MAG: nucleotidyltransferase domain-containing protein [Halobaculum sp.]